MVVVRVGTAVLWLWCASGGCGSRVGMWTWYAETEDVVGGDGTGDLAEGDKRDESQNES